jgi:hypothetical protein
MHTFMEIIYPWFPAILQLVLVVYMLRRKLYRHFQFFFAYTVFSVAATTARQSVIKHNFIYWITYWPTEVIYGILALAAISEAFKRIFLSFYTTFRWFRLVLPGIIFLIIALAAWSAVQYPLSLPGIPAVIYNFHLGIHFLELGIMLCLILLVRILGAQLQQPASGILYGFGTSAGFTMLSYLLIYEFRTKHEISLRYISSMGYLVAVVVWLYFFFKPQPPRVKVTAVDVEKLAELMKTQLDATKRMLPWREILSWIRTLFWRRKR